MTFLVLTDSRNYNLEHRFALKLDNLSSLFNSSPFCYTSKARVRKHGYLKGGLGWFLESPTDVYFRWFKFTLKPSYNIVCDKVRLATRYLKTYPRTYSGHF